LVEWQKRLADMEKGLGTWEKAEFDDAAWAPAKLGPWESNGMPDFDGYVWYRAKFDVDLGFAGLPLHLELGEIDDEDLTFVNGVKVGETKVWNQKRVYQVPADVLRTGTNVLAVRVLDTGGGGGLTTPGLIRLQVGDHECKLSAWKTKVSVNLKDTNPPGAQRWPAADLYNGMIAPLLPYAIKGALWYQGESNVGRAYQYRQSFPALIKNWREDFSNALPFYFVQIAPFTGYGGGGASAELREAQMMTLSLPRTGMVVTTDITDNYADIHPVNKWEVGRRLALLALNRTYGKRQIDSGPLYRSHKIEGPAIRVTFDSAGEHLEIRGQDLADLMIAGEDRKFVPAKCRIDKNAIVVWADGVSKPVAVRYGFGDAPKPGLFNSAGLPSSPFRTDTWPGVTERTGW
jgi:sialate O-acetylesterase